LPARRATGQGVASAVAAAAVLCALAPAPVAPPPREAPYVPTPAVVVERMLDLAGVGSGDVVYDLGCGDGRIAIAAVKRPGVRGVCVEIDPARLMQGRLNARKEGVEDHIRFVERDLPVRRTRPVQGPAARRHRGDALPAARGQVRRRALYSPGRVMPKSLQIRFTTGSTISVCRGTALVFRLAGFQKIE
jgi:SAM-dependent methyltransferase